MVKLNGCIFLLASNSIKKELDCKIIYNKIFLKTKIISYGNKAKNVQSREIPEAGCGYVFWLVVLIDSVFKKDQNCYPQLCFK